MTRRSRGRCSAPVAPHAEVRSRLTALTGYAACLTGVEAFVIAVTTHFCPLYALLGISTCSRDKVVTG